MHNPSFYPNIEAERARHGLSNDDLSKRLGVSRKTLYNWQRTGHIPSEKLLKMADMFGCTVDYLLRREVANAAPDP